MLRNICLKVTRGFTSHTIQPILQPYLNLRKKQFEKYRFQEMNQNIEGQFSVEGSIKFSEKHPEVVMKNWVSDKKFKISNVGVGTYTGSLDQTDDILQFNALIDSVLMGVNMIDTCSNFRGGRSQLMVGHALRYLMENKNYERNQILIASKAGFVREKMPINLTSQVVNNHCVDPLYLEQSLQKSLENMKIKSLDIFYINNFAESQLKFLGREKFEQSLCKVFEFCQKSRKQKKIQYYGLASWESFRLAPNHPLHLNLKSICKLAEKVGGLNHGFRFVQVPINVMMPEVFAQKNQQFGSLLQTAQALKINVVSCSPLLNGSLINIPLPNNKLKCRNNGAKHLQLVRSIPSPALVCSLIGHKTNRHTKKNFQILHQPLLTQEEWFQIFVPQQKPNQIHS